ncbi:MAG TPA: hypothetical protein DCF73_00380 [Rhodobiaceae bacterium]|nr:hypothetical protein [Rhodobiaceae bacterium]
MSPGTWFQGRVSQQAFHNATSAPRSSSRAGRTLTDSISMFDMCLLRAPGKAQQPDMAFCL